MQAQGLQIPNHQVYGFASLLVPGLGHFLQRALFRGVLWLTGALTLWYLLSLSLSSWVHFEVPPSLLAPVVALYHCASMYAAMAHSYQLQREQTPLHAAQEMMPVYLWKQIIGGALVIVGAVAVLLLSGSFGDYVYHWLASQARGGGWWGRPAWGHFLSQSVILWGMTALGVWLFRSGHAESNTAREALRERAVIAYALQNGGRITVAEASVAAQISLHEARNLLERLVLERYAVESEQDGILYYHLTR
jgi:hypothetical protein